jgi:hypothetical protein
MRDKNGHSLLETCRGGKLTEEQEDLNHRRNQFLLAVGIAGPDGRVVDINGQPTGYHRRGQVQVLKQKKDRGGTAVVVDIGGEGEHDRAINVNVKTIGGTKPFALGPIVRKKNTFEQEIPRLVLRKDCDGRLPFQNNSVDKIIVQGTPVGRGTAAEIARIIAPGGQIEMAHPDDDSINSQKNLIDAIGDRGTVSTTNNLEINFTIITITKEE